MNEEMRMRKISLIGMLLIILCFLMPSSAMAQKQTMTVKIAKGEARVSYLDGSAQVLPKGGRDWRPLKVDDVLHGSDEVAVGKKSRLEIILPDKSSLRFAEVTRFKIMQVSEAEANDVKVYVSLGRTWANVSKALGIKRKFEISCENAVAGVRGTVYRMNVEEDKAALIRVYDGEVAVSGASRPLDTGEQVFGKKPTKISGPKPIAGPQKITMDEWTVLLRSMQQISIRSDGTADKPREFTELEDRDEWVDWNKTRDQE
jgi:ferric-dicitrate binding protein FerR (iron transport regulator)